MIDSQKKGYSMKKVLILAGIVALTATTQVFAQEAQKPQGPCPMMGGERPRIECGCPQKGPHGDFKKFEEELNLTDIQKAQLKQIKEKEAHAIKPLCDRIQAKRHDAEGIFNEKLTAQERQEKLAPIDREIEQTKAQIRDIKRQSREEFKSILTDKQVKKLEKLKKQDRKKAEKFEKKNGHVGRPPMGPDGRPPMGPEGRPPMGKGCGQPPVAPDGIPQPPVQK
jgi:Spy/CpxP family protein refolding chaperone